MTDVSVSVLSVEKENATSVFYNLEASKIDYFHIDVMDGEFVRRNNYDLMKDYSLTISMISNQGLDVHLMVKDVKDAIYDFLDYNPETITFHIEAMHSEEETLEMINLIKENGVNVGIAISPDTSIDEIKPFLEYIHLCLVMTVVPGEGGQKLIPETINKIKELKEYVEKENISIDIEADGGINAETVNSVKEAGANILVAGNYIISSENYSDAVKSLR